jgi:hypothetical protein
MDTRVEHWPFFGQTIGKYLKTNDDPELWETAVERILSDAELLCRRHRGRRGIFAQIGSCSHWMAPHNKGSWFRDVRFAWPTGYGGAGFTIYGLPEFDWFASWKWIAEDSHWGPVERIGGKRPLILRVALPTRTAARVRAVAHVLWTPGSPTTPAEELRQGYAFQRRDGRWQYVATAGSEAPYEGIGSR